MTPTNSEKSEMLDLRAQAHAWVDSLIVSGVAENAAVTAFHMSLIERALARGGVEQTAGWLRGMAAQVETNGPALLAELQRQGHA